jgi:hypothetical protein
MMRVPIWAITLMFVAGTSLAAPPSLELPVRVPQPEPPTLSEDWSLEDLVLSAEEEEAAEELVIARKRSKKGGSRGGARKKKHGGFKSGSKRQAQRGGDRGGSARSGGRGGRSGDSDRSVNVDRDVHVDADDLDDAYTSDEEKLGAALLGGVIGLGVGKALADEPDPGYVEHPEAY